MINEYDEKILVDNISFALKELGKKIGDLEEETGVSAGYLSRIKKGNIRPGVDFLLKVSEVLGISTDVLMKTNIARMSSTEVYLLNFIKKLEIDTVDEKLDWIIEKKEDLNNMESDWEGETSDPMFSVQTFYQESEMDYPEEVTKVVFKSDSFGCNTYIKEDCFKLKMDNKAVLYLMSISKDCYKCGDISAFAKEMWMYHPKVGGHFLCSNRSGNEIATALDSLYETLREYSKHPRINRKIQDVIDAFMNNESKNDMEQDENTFCVMDPDDLPF